MTPSLRTAAPVALVCMLLTGCDSMPTILSAPEAPSQALVAQRTSIPSRDDEEKQPRWSTRSDQEVWNEAASVDTVFSIGLKAPGAVRGNYRGKALMTRPEWLNAISAITGQAGVHVVRVDSTHLPVIRARIPDPSVMSRIRRLPFVDYLEPTGVRALLASGGSGCDQSAYGGDPVIPVPGFFGVDTMPAK